MVMHNIIQREATRKWGYKIEHYLQWQTDIGICIYLLPFQWPYMTRNPDFKVTSLLSSLSKSRIIVNRATQHRAVSLWQPSFLLNQQFHFTSASGSLDFCTKIINIYIYILVRRYCWLGVIVNCAFETVQCVSWQNITDMYVYWQRC